MNLLRSQNRINELMSRFVAQINGATAMSRTDINKVSETILIPLLAEVYGYTELKNLNSSEYPNYPAIDLGDERARVAFQITSTSGRGKINKTLRKFVEHELYEKYDKLIIYILTEKPDSSGKGYEEIIQGKFAFDKDKDIWDYRNILKEISNFQCIDKVRRIESILEAHFGEGRTLTEWEVVDNAERIVNEYTQLFVGREEESQKLDKFLSENSSGVMLVTAGAGFGKTALLANWVNAWRDKDYFIAYHFFTQRYRSVKSAYRNLLRQLYIYYKPTYEQIPNDEEELKIRLYNLLRDYAAREGEPLIIVIDGLDEAENTFSPPFPNPLPENVFVIASARAEEGEEHKYLEYWTDNSQQLNLNRLSCGAIAQWLRNTVELAAFAEDTSFVAQLDEITQGFPLYLSYLTDELSHAAKQEQDVREVLAQTPKGFERYVEQQLRRLDELDLPDERWQFFALLAVAKGALEKEDIKALTGMRDRSLRQLNQSWQVTRWMRITEGKLYAFAHPLLAKTFAAQLEDDDDAKDALKNLIDYCAQWEKHQSRYALRHYAEHLREVEKWEELYAIARKKDFAIAQQEQLSDEPDLPLKTVQIALQGAGKRDDVGAMAELMLVHAHRLGQTNAQESPLEALRSGSLERALGLADDFYEIERRVLWYLLLAWELKDTGRLEEARGTLERLQIKQLPRFSIHAATLWQGNYAAYFLAYIFDVNQDTWIVLVKQLFENYHRSLLCKIFSDHGDFDALKRIAISQAEERDFINYANARKIAEENEDSTRQPNDLWTLAYTHAKAENFPAVLEITEGGINGLTQIETLDFIAKALAEDGETQIARATFAAALKMPQEAEPEFLQALALVKVAGVQVTVEQKKGTATARKAHEITQRINSPTKQVSIKSQVAEVLTKAGKGKEAEAIFDSAIEIAQSSETQGERVYSFKIIAEAQVRLKKFADARKTAQRIELPCSKAEVFGIIAKAEAEDGQDEAQSTLTTASEIAEGHSLDWIDALCAIALAQAVIDKEAALATFKKLFVSAKKLVRQRDSYLLKIAAAEALAGEIFHAQGTTDEIEDESDLVQALSWIALAQFKKGKKQELSKTLTTALQAKDKIEDKQKLMQALKAIAGIQAMAGKGEEAVRTAETILTERNLYLPGVASWLVETGDKVNFKKLWIPCAYYVDAAYRMCGHLARLYPEKAEEIAKVVSELN
jgi:hypothetical protein